MKYKKKYPMFLLAKFYLGNINQFYHIKFPFNYNV